MSRVFRDPETRYLEDFQVGDVIETRGRTIETADFNLFAGLTGDYYPFHIDEEAAKMTRFGTRIAHGPLTFTIAVGLVGMTGYYGDGIVALVEIRSLRALKPVKPGDTLRVRAAIASALPGDNPKYGTIEVEYVVLNQRAEEVMKFIQVMLARRQPETGGNNG